MESAIDDTSSQGESNSDELVIDKQMIKTDRIAPVVIVSPPLNWISTSQRFLHLSGSQASWSKLPDCLYNVPEKELHLSTPTHHNNPDIERLLKEELGSFPPYEQHRIKKGWLDWKMIRDYKRRCVAQHFSPLRLRLNAIRKNTIIPKEVQDIAASQLHSLPRDSCWTRTMTRCVVTSRRRGVKTRWRVSRIVWRKLADYNLLSGSQRSFYMYNTYRERKNMDWPPPENLSVQEYLERYHKNLIDKKYLDRLKE